MKNVLLAFFAMILIGCNSNAQKKQSSQTPQYKVSKTEAEWKSELTPAQFTVLRKAGTERPFSSDLNKIKEPGTFVCAACGNELYLTKHKFESGTGWPSFDRPLEGAVAYGADSKLGFERDEVHCADCGGHLGHLFDDGPRETTGKRHCINGVAMKFIPDGKK
ncbi:peptide-methionine (R)-S-oxide reductase MsrB [Antarcticibacterium arcticum]|uniref:peptide-methionine (R)-S-oxide reductase n=1 Tax=Antarcticibacterium arcticum TaxID=2585771 RepID=A0A5B8YFQ5_9FLAO|nr:peptide-methionine (R)-S-oxide reductase MsrB [Antarcticibacterium arcticum]QED36780.1 peptide-methionine (R)-S-oxide reductase MsrB [Antarcticibacterium arcticum]